MLPFALYYTSLAASVPGIHIMDNGLLYAALKCVDDWFSLASLIRS